MKKYSVETLIQEVENGHIARDGDKIYMTKSTITFVYEAIASADLTNLEIRSRIDDCVECHIDRYGKDAFLELLRHTLKHLENDLDWSIASRLPINTFKGLSNQQAALTICKLLSETINQVNGDYFDLHWGKPFCNQHSWRHLEDICI